MDTGDSSLLPLCSSKIADKIARGEYVLRDEQPSRSRVWTIFAKIDDLNGDTVPGYVCCRVCKKVSTFGKAASTSNLVKHKCYFLKYVYKVASSEVQPAEIPHFDNSNTSFECGVSDNTHNNLMNLFTKCLIKDCRSYELLQNDDFKTILRELIAFGAKFGTNTDIDKLIPKTTAINRNVNEIYENCFARVYSELAAIKQNGFGLAFHLWQNNFPKRNYYVLTMHFLKYGKITCRLLALRSAEGEKNSSQNITHKIEHILKDFDCELSNKSIVVASGCNDILQDQMLPCISSLLNDALTKSMDEVPEISEMVTNCMKLRSFLNRNEIFVMPDQHICPNSWISLYKVLELITCCWVKIEVTLKFQSEEAQMDSINISHLEAVVKTLRPFQDAIESLEEDGIATLHLVIVYLHDLKKSCEASESEFDDYNFIKSLKKLLLQRLDEFVNKNITILHKVALFLYPPAKKLRQFNDAEKDRIEKECMRLMKCFKPDSKPTIKPEPESVCTPQSKRRKLFSDFVDSETNGDPDDLIMEELQVYKLARVTDSENFNVLSWWEQQEPNFPILYKLSRMILSTPATSISARRIFASTGGLFSDQTSDICSNERDKESIAFIKFNVEQDELDSKLQV